MSASTYDLKVLGNRLLDMHRIVTAFPPCADLFLSQIIKDRDEKEGKLPYDGLTFFKEYFTPMRHTIFTDQNQNFEENAFICGGNKDNSDDATVNKRTNSLDNCLPSPCITLGGIRGSSALLSAIPSTPPPASKAASKAARINGIRRIAPGDLVWAFWLDRFGTFQIQGAILDDFATKGNIPFDVSDPTNEITAIIIEAMVRQMKTGLLSSVRDRESTYRRVLGWTTEPGRKLGLETQINSGFSNLFHKFIQNALDYYKERRLATAIQGTSSISKPSTATVTMIGNTLLLLRRSTESFVYGRNYYNTLSAIVQIVAIIDVVKHLRGSLPIPSAFEATHEYMTAAKDILIHKKPITHSEANPYELHKTCAENGRDILLDIEVIAEDEIKNSTETGPLATWLNLIEHRVEAYRTAYRSLTNIDLGDPGIPRVEQQA